MLWGSAHFRKPSFVYNLYQFVTLPRLFFDCTIWRVLLTSFTLQSNNIAVTNGTFLHYWLVVSTHLKNISQLGWLFPTYGWMKNVPNHQPDYFTYKNMAMFNGFSMSPTATRHSQDLPPARSTVELLAYWPPIPGLNGMQWSDLDNLGVSPWLNPQENAYRWYGWYRWQILCTARYCEIEVLKRHAFFFPQYCHPLADSSRMAVSESDSTACVTSLTYPQKIPFSHFLHCWEILYI